MVQIFSACLKFHELIKTNLTFQTSTGPLELIGRRLLPVELLALWLADDRVCWLLPPSAVSPQKATGVCVCLDPSGAESHPWWSCSRLDPAGGSEPGRAAPLFRTTAKELNCECLFITCWVKLTELRTGPGRTPAAQSTDPVLLHRFPPLRFSEPVWMYRDGFWSVFTHHTLTDLCRCHRVGLDRVGSGGRPPQVFSSQQRENKTNQGFLFLGLAPIRSVCCDLWPLHRLHGNYLKCWMCFYESLLKF